MKPPVPEPPRKGRKREPRQSKDRNERRGWDEAGREGAELVSKHDKKRVRDT